jgi:hypothetical protein
VDVRDSCNKIGWLVVKIINFREIRSWCKFESLLTMSCGYNHNFRVAVHGGHITSTDNYNYDVVVHYATGINVAYHDVIKHHIA